MARYTTTINGKRVTVNAASDEEADMAFNDYKASLESPAAPAPEAPAPAAGGPAAPGAGLPIDITSPMGYEPPPEAATDFSIPRRTPDASAVTPMAYMQSQLGFGQRQASPEALQGMSSNVPFKGTPGQALTDEEQANLEAAQGYPATQQQQGYIPFGKIPFTDTALFAREPEGLTEKQKPNLLERMIPRTPAAVGTAAGVAWGGLHRVGEAVGGEETAKRIEEEQRAAERAGPLAYNIGKGFGMGVSALSGAHLWQAAGGPMATSLWGKLGQNALAGYGGGWLHGALATPRDSSAEAMIEAGKTDAFLSGAISAAAGPLSVPILSAGAAIGRKVGHLLPDVAKQGINLPQWVPEGIREKFGRDFATQEAAAVLNQTARESVPRRALPNDAELQALYEELGGAEAGVTALDVLARKGYATILEQAARFDPRAHEKLLKFYDARLEDIKKRTATKVEEFGKTPLAERVAGLPAPSRTHYLDTGNQNVDTVVHATRDSATADRNIALSDSNGNPRMFRANPNDPADVALGQGMATDAGQDAFRRAQQAIAQQDKLPSGTVPPPTLKLYDQYARELQGEAYKLKQQAEHSADRSRLIAESNQLLRLAADARTAIGTRAPGDAYQQSLAKYQESFKMIENFDAGKNFYKIAQDPDQQNLLLRDITQASSDQQNAFATGLIQRWLGESTAAQAAKGSVDAIRLDRVTRSALESLPEFKAMKDNWPELENWLESATQQIKVQTRNPAGSLIAGSSQNRAAENTATYGRAIAGFSISSMLSAINRGVQGNTIGRKRESALKIIELVTGSKDPAKTLKVLADARHYPALSGQGAAVALGSLPGGWDSYNMNEGGRPPPTREELSAMGIPPIDLPTRSGAPLRASP